MADGAWLRVPVGPETGRWATRTGCRTVLLVVHNVTAATRLLDVLPLFDGDLRVQVLTTCTGSGAAVGAGEGDPGGPGDIGQLRR
jgi:hypothetical protein